MTDRNPDYHCAVCRAYLFSGRAGEDTEPGPHYCAKHKPRKVRTSSKEQGVVRVVRFAALDGTEHETHAAARKHNTDTSLQRFLWEFFDNEYTRDGWGSADDCAKLAKALRAEWAISKRKEKGK